MEELDLEQQAQIANLQQQRTSQANQAEDRAAKAFDAEKKRNASAWLPHIKGAKTQEERDQIEQVMLEQAPHEHDLLKDHFDAPRKKAEAEQKARSTRAAQMDVVSENAAKEWHQAAMKDEDGYQLGSEGAVANYQKSRLATFNKAVSKKLKTLNPKASRIPGMSTWYRNTQADIEGMRAGVPWSDPFDLVQELPAKKRDEFIAWSREINQLGPDASDDEKNQQMSRHFSRWLEENRW